ncbi:MAG: hypothetical protein ACP5N9_03185 [Candidatus Bilamarchaeum sp.]|jgi:hypothetical protein
MTRRQRRDRFDSDSPAMVGMKAPPISKSKDGIERNIEALSKVVPDTEASYQLLRRIIHVTVIPKTRALLSTIKDETGAAHLAALDHELTVLNDRIKNDNLNQPVRVPSSLRDAAVSKREDDVKDAYRVFYANLSSHYRGCGIELPAVDGL